MVKTVRIKVLYSGSLDIAIPKDEYDVEGYIEYELDRRLAWLPEDFGEVTFDDWKYEVTE